MNRLAGKFALITGGASGIGAATARRFVAEGAQVVIVDVNDALGQAVAQELGAAKCRYRHCDVTQLADVERAVSEAQAFFERSNGTLNVLFNNAGVGLLGETPDVDPAEWRRIIDIDLNAVFYGCRAAIPLMRANGGGAIVNTASISGLFGDYALGAYNAAKAGVINYTRTLALDHGKHGIRANALCPGIVDTPLTAAAKGVPDFYAAFVASIPLGRAGTADEMANAVVFLASDEASYVTGAALVVDGGRTAGTNQPSFLSLANELGLPGGNR